MISNSLDCAFTWYEDVCSEEMSWFDVFINLEKIECEKFKPAIDFNQNLKEAFGYIATTEGDLYWHRLGEQFCEALYECRARS